MYQLFRRVGGDIYPEDSRLRVGRNGNDKAQGTFSHLYQGAGTGDVPAGNHRLPHHRNDAPRRAGKERAFPLQRPDRRAGGNDREARRLCQQREVGRFGVGYSEAGKPRQVENARGYHGGTQNVA